jgi:hypothetical protein
VMSTWALQLLTGPATRCWWRSPASYLAPLPTYLHTLQHPQDPQQLPPTVKSRLAEQLGLGIPLLTRLQVGWGGPPSAVTESKSGQQVNCSCFLIAATNATGTEPLDEKAYRQQVTCCYASCRRWA